MTAAQVAANHRAVAALADTLAAWGLTDPMQRAEHLTRQLADAGWRPIEPPPTLRGPQSSTAGRLAARELFEQTRRAKEQAR